MSFRILLALAPALLLAGCLLSPRKPGGGGGGTACFKALPATNDYTEVFTNLEGALKCLQQSIYLDFIHGDFEFLPSASAVNDYPSVFAVPWGLNQEQQWFSLLAGNTASLTAQLRVRDISDPTNAGDEATVEAEYEITQTPPGGTPIVYSGQALYTLEVSGTKWVLKTWEDRDAGGLAVGHLRGSLLQ